MTVTISSTGENLQLTSLSDLLTDLRVALDSPSGTGTKWTDAQLQLCINRIIRELASFVWVKGVWETTSDSDDRDYQLPQYVEEIVSVTTQGGETSVLSLEEGPEVPVLGRRHLRTPHSNLLKLQYLPPAGSTLRVYYRQRMQVPPQDAALDLGANIASTTATTVTISSPFSLPVPGYVRIDNEVIYYAGIDASGLTDCTRGELGTTAATHTAGSNNVLPLFPMDGRVHEVVMKGATMRAYDLRLKGAPHGDVALTVENYRNAKEEYQRARKTLQGGSGGIQVPNLWNTRRRRRSPLP